VAGGEGKEVTWLEMQSDCFRNVLCAGIKREADGDQVGVQLVPEAKAVMLGSMFGIETAGS
jgi:hypothetical protein